MPNVSLAPWRKRRPSAFRQTRRHTWRSLPGVPAVAPGWDAFIHSLIQAMLGAKWHRSSPRQKPPFLHDRVVIIAPVSGGHLPD
jgi:hypothetical protein